MLTSLKNFILDLMFPRQCLGCKQNDTWLCQSCFKLIEQFEGQSIDYTPKQLERLIIASPYSKNKLLTKAIKILKYKRRSEDIAEKLGSMLARSLHFAMNQVTAQPHAKYCLVPVPLHQKRQKERGFNQAELLARVVSDTLNIPLETELLKRDRYTTSQVKTGSKKARLKNLAGAFSLNSKPDPNTTYILIDDVASTGATLEECAKTLQQAGAKAIWGLAIARN